VLPTRPSADGDPGPRPAVTPGTAPASTGPQVAETRQVLDMVGLGSGHRSRPPATTRGAGADTCRPRRSSPHVAPACSPTSAAPPTRCRLGPPPSTRCPVPRWTARTRSRAGPRSAGREPRPRGGPTQQRSGARWNAAGCPGSGRSLLELAGCAHPHDVRRGEGRRCLNETDRTAVIVGRRRSRGPPRRCTGLRRRALLRVRRAVAAALAAGDADAMTALDADLGASCWPPGADLAGRGSRVPASTAELCWRGDPWAQLLRRPLALTRARDHRCRGVTSSPWPTEPPARARRTPRTWPPRPTRGPASSRRPRTPSSRPARGAGAR
jgi:hypothetical protein